MAVYDREQIDVEFAEDSVGETRAIDAGEMTISFERLKAGFSTAPLRGVCLGMRASARTGASS